MKILVIEDEKLLADSIKTLLEGKGFEVEVAYETLKEAETDWEAFRREPNPIFDSFCDDIFGDG